MIQRKSQSSVTLARATSFNKGGSKHENEHTIQL